MAGALPRSPLAPAEDPVLPPVAGVRVAAGAVGVRYEGRTDVALIELAPGTALAGAFTRSATRSAAVLDCEAKLRTDPNAGAGPGAGSGPAAGSAPGAGGSPSADSSLGGSLGPSAGTGSDGDAPGAAILVNSGNANAFTGRHGDGSVRALVEAAAAATGACPRRGCSPPPPASSASGCPTSGSRRRWIASRATCARTASWTPRARS